jgi:hypothetical protein
MDHFDLMYRLLTNPATIAFRYVSRRELLRVVRHAELLVGPRTFMFPGDDGIAVAESGSIEATDLNTKVTLQRGEVVTMTSVVLASTLEQARRTGAPRPMRERHPTLGAEVALLPKATPSRFLNGPVILAAGARCWWIATAKVRDLYAAMLSR